MILFLSSALAAPSLEQRLTTILDRNLFNAYRGGYSGCTYSPTPEAALPAVLVGTLVAKPAEYSSALVSIREESRREGTLVALSVGDTLLGLQIDEIHSDRIALLSATGARSYLTMKVP